MGAELVTIVAVRRTSPVGTDEVERLTFAGPTGALAALDDLLATEPTLAIGVDITELPDDARSSPAVDLATSLARRARPGEVLVTDVVAQLAGGTERTFSGRGHADGAGRPTRVHALAPEQEVPTRPTFGRALELASLDWLVDELLVGSGRAVVLDGEAGIGKSHLAAEARTRAERAGVLVAGATAAELGRDRPGHVAGALLAQLARRAADGAGDRPGLGRGDHAFVDQFTAIVEASAQERPVLLIVEDLHWADDLSLRALGALSSRLAPISAAVVVTCRPAPRPELLTKLVDALEAAGAEHHDLDPLESDAVTSLVATLTGAPPGPRLRDRLVATAGNPLFVIEMLDALGHDGVLDVDAGVVDLTTDDIELPGRLRDTALRRLRDLPEPTVRLLRHACLLGGSAHLESLATITGHPATLVTGELAPAVQAGVLAHTGDTVTFRHDVIREAIIADLPPAVRREMHTTAGHALAGAGASPMEVARQLALGARPGDTEPVEWLERAAADVRELDPSATVELLEEALDLAPPRWTGTERLRCSMIEPLTACGRVDDAIENGRTTLADATDPAVRKRATNGLVSALATRGDLRGAAEVAARFGSEPGTGPGDRRLFDCIATSLRIFVDGSSAEAERAADAALDAGAGHPPTDHEDEVACWATSSLGLAALVDGRYETALDRFDESSRLLDRLEISDHGFLIPHLNAATASAYLDRFEDFHRRRHAVAARCTARGEASPLVISHFGGAAIGFVTGDWDGAVTEVEAGLSLAADTGADSMTVGLHAIAALVDAGRGSPETADEHVQRGFDLLQRGAHLFGVDLLVLARARLLDEAGPGGEAAELLCALWDQAGPIALALQHRQLLPHLVRISGSRLGDRQADVLRAAERAAANAPVPSIIAAAARCEGLATGEADPLLAAVEQQRQSPRRVELAETCEEAAAACFGAGRSEEAGRLVDEAVGIWDGAGATAHVARVDALARAHGVRRRRSRPSGTAHGWDSLSPKELEVVELVADGLSNPAIGQRLYISRRTVESHLSHVFTKLGLSNRAQVAAAVVERRARSQDP